MRQNNHLRKETVVWKGDDLDRVAGTPVRLRFVMQEADLFSLSFKA